MSEVEVHGMAELTKELQAIPTRLARRILVKAFRKATKPIVQQVKGDVPVKTGAIKRNVVAKQGPRRYKRDLDVRYIIGIRHGKVRKNETTYIARGGKKRVRKLTAYDKRGEDPFYYRFQELGFKPGGGQTFVPGKRFLTNALQVVAKQATAIVIAESKIAIQNGALKK